MYPERRSTVMRKTYIGIFVCIALVACIITFTGGYFAAKHKYLHQESTKKDKQVPASSKFTKWRQGDSCPDMKNVTCPKSFPKNGPLILISLDGFRADYLLRKMTPAIQRLINCGVHSPYMRSVYPTKTFPNHYSIVTGLYPEHHGIVDNTMYDPITKDTFKLGKEAVFNPEWWKGEPLWNTVVKNNKKSATYFWPGSDVKISGLRPTYFRKFDQTMDFPSRVDTVISWLSLPADSRPDFITLYFSQPDQFGHYYGPQSKKINEALQLVDNMIDRLMQMLTDHKLVGCVNVMIVADHGMSHVPCDHAIKIDPLVNTSGMFFRDGPIGQIRPLSSKLSPKEIADKLVCKDKHMRVYMKGQTPVRFHYSENVRICPVILDIDDGYVVKRNKYEWCNGGEHGYDNMDVSMRALFLAHGKIFQQKMMVPAFQNIELYDLMAEILEIKPAKNDGTAGSLHHLLNLKPLPENDRNSSTAGTYGKIPNNPDKTGCNCKIVPDTRIKYDNRLTAYLDMAAPERSKSYDKSNPYGISTGLNSVKILINQDYALGFDENLQIPLFASYVVNTTATNSTNRCWRSDVRLVTSPTCTQYQRDYYVKNNISMSQLFSSHFSSSSSSVPDTWVTSNSLPMYNTFKDTLVIPKVQEFIEGLRNKFGSLQVINGPVYKYGTDDKENSESDIKKHYRVPSHFFFIVTSCNVKVTDLSSCDDNKLQSRAYILPHTEALDNCQDFAEWFHRNSARIRDVELLSGLEFFTKLKIKVALKLRTALPYAEQV